MMGHHHPTLCALALWVVGACAPAPVSEPAPAPEPVPAPEPEPPTSSPPPEPTAVPVPDTIPAPPVLRYEIGEGLVSFGTIAQAANGSIDFAPAAHARCLADTLQEQWRAFKRPPVVTLKRGSHEGDAHVLRGYRFDRAHAFYPFAVLESFLDPGRYNVEPGVPLGLAGEVRATATQRFEVSISRSAMTDDDPPFTRLPLGVFEILPNGKIVLDTACPGEYLRPRLEALSALTEVVVGFDQREGTLHPTPAEQADITKRYERGDREFFAALMTHAQWDFLRATVTPPPTLTTAGGSVVAPAPR